jgi:hypothetical protein
MMSGDRQTLTERPRGAQTFRSEPVHAPATFDTWPRLRILLPNFTSVSMKL